MRNRAAVFTIVTYEPALLPLWLKYYSRFFAAEDIHVVRHLVHPGEINFVKKKEKIEGCQFSTFVHENRYEFAEVSKYAILKQELLLNDYEVVLYCDVDEFLVPNPDKHNNLGEFIDKFIEWPDLCVTALGYEIFHKRNEEPPIDLGKPLMAQRHWWIQLDSYNKPLLSKVKLNWCQGQHYCQFPGNFKELNLVHLRRLDYEICRSRNGGMRITMTRGFNLQKMDFDEWYNSRVNGFEKFNLENVVEIPKEFQDSF